ncbi:MAG: hypothetical protein UU65_C0002G0230 [candidate division CPR2 bacterium GW2011_GWC1_41_48]|uniref:Carrier domain-containing protein n=1 Tax=candidate division CPR2 bacterium GW2011_GWC1_41_48 TaxID=1618344 RepID=A0A0G0WBK3_UNCC2|nr:MAG: hypothetical protein UT47_C0002G0074 [candidate division CPR2 bacterium GW2011_GWC2_39_35]KKS09452.1 MAG: hypothetical protein UU65_C0002G0230 [candidate division CPR2 bacterium GW2011_GWC1_41_48]
MSRLIDLDNRVSSALVGVLREVPGLKEEDIESLENDSSFWDLGLDNLDIVEIIMSLEESLNIEDIEVGAIPSRIADAIDKYPTPISLIEAANQAMANADNQSL